MRYDPVFPIDLMHIYCRLTPLVQFHHIISGYLRKIRMPSIKMCRENEMFLYPDIPRIEESYIEYPAKIFVIEQRVAGEFLFRVTMDNDQPRSSHASVFTGPGTHYHFDLTERGTAEGIEKIITGLREVNFFIPERRDFVLGAVDVVTYPFYYALINNMDR